MSLESEIENQPFAVRRVLLASGWRQGLTPLFNVSVAVFCHGLHWASVITVTDSGLIKINGYSLKKIREML